MSHSESQKIHPISDTSSGICLHCGNPLERFHREEDGPFCCAGCRTVYHLIQGEGLGRYYDLRPDALPPASDLRPDSFSWLDPIVDSAEGGQLRLDIQGLHCAACVWLIEELHEREKPGGSLRINPAQGKVDLLWDGDRSELKRWLTLVERFGYRFGPSRKDEKSPSRALLLRLGITTALAMNVMIFSASYYFGLSADDGPIFRFFAWLNLSLSSVSVLVGGPVFFRSAFQGLRHGLVHLDLPISLGILLAWIGSLLAFFLIGPEAAYFDTLAIFISLMLLGRWVQERILERNRLALLQSDGVESLYTRTYRNHHLESLPAQELKTGDEVWVAPGELLPVEAILIRRPASLSLDWISGESEERQFQPGDRLPAGSFNAGRQGFRAASLQDFRKSRLNELLRSPAGQEQIKRSPWNSRVSTIYVAWVLLSALAGFLAWAGKDLTRALEVCVAILVVTCPCALGLATPLARELIQAALRRRGVLIRRGSFLDRATSIRKILFDKTGTLSSGKLALSEKSRETLLDLGKEELSALWNLVNRSSHPVSAALRNAMKPQTLDPDSENTIEIEGRGLEWRETSGVWRLGRADFAGGIPGATSFSLNGEILARFHFEEEIRPGAVEEVTALQKEGYELWLLSGDLDSKVSAMSERLGIPEARAEGELSPEEKARRVQDLDCDDTIMVGDGLNDAPAFDVAFASATPAVDRAALSARADFYYLGDGIAALGRALRSVLKLRRMIRLNLLFAAVYNLAAVAMSIAGLVNPLVAALLMPASSILIVGFTAWKLSGRRLRWMS